MLLFEKKDISARLIDPSGKELERRIQVRVNPISGRTCRISLGRSSEKEPGTETLPLPPPNSDDTAACPFCRPQVMSKTPEIIPDIFPEGRLCYNDSILFPNLFPYGGYSAVTLFNNEHFTEIGTASVSSYADCFINSRNYLAHVLAYDPEAFYMAITQNHLPSAGGSLIHPHLQIHADGIAPNHHRFLKKRAEEYFHKTGRYLFSDYLNHEKQDGGRYIGNTGSWEWMTAFAPEGFYEIWGILPEVTSLSRITDSNWNELAKGVVNAQKFYRSICRNGYNLGILFIEDKKSTLEIRVVMIVRSNYNAWVRNDHTAFELMLGDMTTFTLPEDIAEKAGKFWAEPERTS